jgi:NIMA (never in mitosis gene a)-related kinase
MIVSYYGEFYIIFPDLKTQNIFVTSAGIIKLGDLGIARILKMNEDHANTAVGTPYYLSPEICKRKPYPLKSSRGVFK